VRRHVAAFLDATCRVVPKRGHARALQGSLAAESAAPLGLDPILVCNATKMPRLRRWNDESGRQNKTIPAENYNQRKK